MKQYRKIIIFLLLIALNIPCANAADTNDLPASILILTAEGKPEKIYGNKNIDWLTIGFDNKSDWLELTEFEQYLLQHETSDKIIRFAQNYRLINQTFQPENPISLLEFTNWICRIFYRSNYTYKTRTDFDANDTTIAIACEKNFPLTYENKENALDKDTATRTVGQLLASYGLAGINIARLVKEPINQYNACKLLLDLTNFIQPSPPSDKFVYSDSPVVPIIIQPVKCWWDSWNDFHGTSWRILNNNQNQTGYLSNGKPITEENITELLCLAEQIFPDATLWTSKKQMDTAGFTDAWTNNNYNNPSQEMRSLYLTQFNVSPNTACGGFASFLSDLLFGQEANPVRATSVNDLHPGDIRIEEYLTYDMRSEKGPVAHTIFLTRVNKTARLYDYTDGNNNLCVFWNGWHETKMPQTTAAENYNSLYQSQYLYYTRWPENT